MKYLSIITRTVLLVVLFAECQHCNRNRISPSEEIYGIATQYGGIPNVGNTCYMNASLQIVAKLYSDAFNNCEDDDLRECGQAIVEKIKYDRAYVDADQAKKFHAAFLKVAKENQRDEFQKDKQADAQECIQFLFDLLKISPNVYIYNRVVDKETEEVEWRGWEREITHHNLPIPDENNNSIPIEACLASSLNDGDLSGENQYYCSIQQKYVDALKQYRLEINSELLPLPIFLNRSSYDEFFIPKKKENKITNSHQLTIPKALQYCDKQYCGKQDITCSLKGFINHRGNTVYEGHYTAHIQDSSGQWRLYNDSSVTLLQGYPEEAAAKAYIYFYSVN